MPTKSTTKDRYDVDDNEHRSLAPLDHHWTGGGVAHYELRIRYAPRSCTGSAFTQDVSQAYRVQTSEPSADWLEGLAIDDASGRAKQIGNLLTDLRWVSITIGFGQ